MSSTPFGLPSELYHVLLDEQPHYLVPTRLMHAREPAADLVVNPRCWFSWHGPLPPDKAARAAFTEYFCPSDWMVWVDDSATGIVWPFWVGQEYFGYLAEMVPGFPVPVALPERVEWVLREANILVQLNHEGHRRHDWLQALKQTANQFERGYAMLADFVHPFHIGALRRYYRFQTRTGSFVLGDAQVDRHYTAYNEAVSCFYHHQLARLVSEIAARLVKPSYAYFAAYQSGSELPLHTDREQCEYSITICIDATPEPQGQNPWPIELQIPDGMLRVWQHIGDGLLYRGRHLPHSRDRLPRGYSSSSMFLHYVDDDFAGSLD